MVIEVEGLVKRYQGITAVDSISLTVDEGEIFGMVGPNGAGKTTLIECIEGLRKPDEGYLRVLGMQPDKQRRTLYKEIGVQLQETSYQDRAKVEEVCKLFSAFYDKPLCFNALLEDFDLLEKKSAYISTLSGGQRQRLSIILSLIGNPRIIFLDEITTGLDPQARRDMWRYISGLKKEGRTIYLTTHYMEEAEHLCDRVAIMDKGKIIALDAVPNLIASGGLTEMITFEAINIDIDKLKNLPGITNVKRDNNLVTILGNGGNMLSTVVNWLSVNDIDFNNLSNKKPNLEDFYLYKTSQNGNEKGEVI